MATKRKSSMPVSKATNAFELLDEIRKLILEEPKRYSQMKVLCVGLENSSSCSLGMPRCETVGCVAGWTVSLKSERPAYGHETLDRAAAILGLTFEQAQHLFHGHAAGLSEQTPGHAKRGAAHIRKFMLANKEQLKAKKV